VPLLAVGIKVGSGGAEDNIPLLIKDFPQPALIPDDITVAPGFFSYCRGPSFSFVKDML